MCYNAVSGFGKISSYIIDRQILLGSSPYGPDAPRPYRWALRAQ